MYKLLKIFFSTVIIICLCVNTSKLQAQCASSVSAIDNKLCFGESTYISAFSTDTVSSAPPNNYCACQPIATSEADIIHFQLGAINNFTTCNSPFAGSQGVATGLQNIYANFTNSTVPIPTLTAGNTYAFATEIVSCSGPSNNNLYIYIDYNNDGDFLDSLELAYSQINVITPASVTNTITVPTAIASGNTRLRVIVADSAAVIIGACGFYGSGETEDYWVHLIQDSITYLWTPSAGLNTTIGNNVLASPIVNTIYTVTATTPNGCTQTNTILIEVANSTLNSTISNVQNVACFGDSSGSATVMASGGSSPYQYLWLPSGNTTASLNNASASTYTITVVDDFGCSAFNAVSISQPALLNVNSNVVNSKCYEPATGSIQLQTSGGITPYTYVWSPNVSSNAFANNLSGGTYQTVITDANNCSKTISSVVNSPSALISTIATQINMATAFVSGGLPPYTYLWQPGAYNTQTISNVAGNYTLTITDTAGCSSTKIVSIPAPLGTSNSFEKTPKIFQIANTVFIESENVRSVDLYTVLGGKLDVSVNINANSATILLPNMQTNSIYLIVVQLRDGTTFSKQLVF